ncbi:aminotransferase class I/II-fold pyridoxal phosphate-dependent enzyme [Methylonatrum kenyense]|uniref:trans-sulfuration enzyme family protein n=1 Tax=Methylonatrum kenyense TaxID=455253 RepID=UPI0020BE842E|nr:aminotransferase class I/II-fold pyridoxal phosphate-dependent enzyme [Methylonatrum kenyense]MCK8515847.1 aminotransferase class I/II-fold pyridoxal phosphate-dependent enzyme [Methylonatrum kenyense]
MRDSNATRRSRATRVIHGADLRDPHGAAHGPIYTATTFAFERTAQLAAAVGSGEARGLYTRYGQNPTLLAVEEQLAELEDAEEAVVFSSGMAAITAACLGVGRAGVAGFGNLYGGTQELLERQLPQLGIPTRLLGSDAVAELPDVLAEGFGLVLTETPSNPDLAVHDLEHLAGTAHRFGALLAVDNTFATPVNQQPMKWGADIVLHSATKYLGGHSDLTAGVALGTAQGMAPLRGWRKQFGQAPAPETAALLSRSLKTLFIRVERHNASAAQLAEVLEAHPHVARVHYPGLPSSPGHSVATRQMTGFGGMLGVEIDGGVDEATRFVDALELFLNAPSLGGVESLVTQPAVTSHTDLSPAERERRGIREQLVRLSIGLEDVDDLRADLKQALDKL